MLIKWNLSKQIHFPGVKNDYFLTYGAEDIISLLEKAPTPKVPIFEGDDETKNALLKLELPLIRRMVLYNKTTRIKYKNPHCTTTCT